MLNWCLQGTFFLVVLGILKGKTKHECNDASCKFCNQSFWDHPLSITDDIASSISNLTGDMGFLSFSRVYKGI